MLGSWINEYQADEDLTFRGNVKLTWGQEEICYLKNNVDTMGQLLGVSRNGFYRCQNDNLLNRDDSEHQKMLRLIKEIESANGFSISILNGVLPKILAEFLMSVIKPDSPVPPCLGRNWLLALWLSLNDQRIARLVLPIAAL